VSGEVSGSGQIHKMTVYFKNYVNMFVKKHIIQFLPTTHHPPPYNAYGPCPLPARRHWALWTRAPLVSLESLESHPPLQYDWRMHATNMNMKIPTIMFPAKLPP